MGDKLIIYKMTNKINGKIYIGQTCKSLRKRIRDHFNDFGKSYIKYSLKKYGRDNFEVEIIDTASSKEELNQKEIYWIKQYNCRIPNGYNICAGGEGANGYHHSEEVKNKMSLTRKGKKQSKELTEKIANGVKLFWSDPKNKERMKKSMENKTPEDERIRRSERKKLFWSDPKNKKDLSERMKAFWDDPEKRKIQIEKFELAKNERKAA